MKIKFIAEKEYYAETNKGSTLLTAARSCPGVYVTANCGGKGTCGRCKTFLSEGKVMTKDGMIEAPSIINLCHSYPLSDCSVRLSTEKTPDANYIEDADCADKLGIAIDLGTTNISALLTDGKKIYGEITQRNRQSVYGADVMTRISFAVDGKARELQAIIKRQLADIVISLTNNCGIEAVEEIVIACNTTMEYLLLGWDASSLGQAPYKTRELSFQNTTIVGIRARIMPGISAFVGGDIVSGMSYLGFIGKKEPTLLLDLGTNGEMALWTGDRLLTTSVPAGPAFESGKVIYGSELLDCAWEKLNDGTMTETGYLLTQSEYQDDIRILQMAKAATMAGIKCLLNESLLGADDIENVIIAGTFGEYINSEAAIGVGMLPEGWQSKIKVVGNAALKGAVMMIYNVEMEKIANQIKDIATVISLADSEKFSEDYVAGMNFPKL